MPRLFYSGPLALPLPTQCGPWSSLLSFLSYSLYQPVSLSLLHVISHLPPFCFLIPLQALHDCLHFSFPSQPYILHFPAARALIHLTFLWLIFSLRHLHYSLDVSSFLFPLCVSFLNSLSVFQQDIKQGPHSRWELIETSAQPDFRWGQPQKDTSRRGTLIISSFLLLFLCPLFKSRGERKSLALIGRGGHTPYVLDNIPFVILCCTILDTRFEVGEF